MSDLESVATRLSRSLHLLRPPVGVRFSNDLPPDVPIFSGTVAAGCEFWERASQQTLVTHAADHQHCAIGVHTHNLPNASPAQDKELGDVLAAMKGVGYVRDDEVAAIPVMKQSYSTVIYGPLESCSGQADVVLLFAHARQSLILSEAVARVDKDLPPAMGRPACAIIPQVMNEGRAALSLGCCGARAYLDSLTDSVSIWALPGNKLQVYTDEVCILADANTTLADFHARRQEDISRGERPSVAQSLARIRH